jgi:hypothetical protein
VRLSTLGQLTGEPASIERVGAGPLRYDFALSFPVPGDLRPHRFFIKALAAAEHDLAFASRVFFVN